MGLSFDMSLSREQAIALLKCGLGETPYWCVMCKEYGDDDDWVGVNASDAESIEEDPSYKTFELWFEKTAFDRLWLSQERELR
jgi:hypothetical protein